MELRHLRYCIAVADELNFNRAAEKLHVSQSALSKQIRELEEEVGIEIFERTKRKVEVTEAGRLFLAEARRTLAQADQTLQIATRAGRGEIGKLVVGLEGSSTYDLIPLILHTYRSRFPQVELVVTEMPTLQQIYALEHKHIDVGFLIQPGDLADNIECERLLQEPLIVALHQSHPLKSQPSVSLQALAKDAFVFVPQSLGCGFFSLVSQIFRSAGYTPGTIQEASQLQTLLSFVAAGMGITLIPASARVFQMPGIVYVDLEPPAPTVDVMVAWRGDDSSPVVRTFLKIVRDNAQTQ